MKPEEPTVANQEEVSQDPDLNTSPVVDGGACSGKLNLSAKKKPLWPLRRRAENYDLYLRALAETENLRKGISGNGRSILNLLRCP